MKYYDTGKDKDNIEIDDLDIKSHLDASLDLSGISVSEDLINRTLEVIKKQATEQPSAQEIMTTKDNNNRKVIQWTRYIRGFAGIAAAAVILVAGYNILNNSGMKKDSSSNMDANTTADIASNTEQTAEENSTFSSLETDDTATKAEDAKESADNGELAGITKDSVMTEMAPQFSIAAGVIEEDEETVTYGLAPEEEISNFASGSVNKDKVKVGVTSGTADSTADSKADGTASAEVPNEQPASDNASLREVKLSFRNIFLSEPEKAQYITLTDNVNGTTITITEESEILDFYDVMNKHQFTYGTEQTSEQNYTVEIGNPEVDATYVMTVGNYITVSYTDNVSSSQSIYEVQDRALLSQDLSDFIAKYSK